MADNFEVDSEAYAAKNQDHQIRSVGPIGSPELPPNIAPPIQLHPQQPGGPPQRSQSPPQPSPQQSLISAIEAHFVALKARSIANLNNYMLNSAGIGEHPDVVEESIKLIEKISHADGNLQTLRRITS